MTDIQITSKWSEVKPQGFYVYLHRRSSSGEIFYVGKGCDNRAWSLSRNRYWKRIARKHGVDIEICQDCMLEDDAFLLEMWTIAKIRHAGGMLCNTSAGGEGPSGFRQSEEANIKRSASLREFYKHNEVERGPCMSMRRSLTCSNGMVFSGAPDAIKWLREDVGIIGDQRNISSCARGERRVAYGFSWVFTDCHNGGSFSYRPAKTRNKKVPVVRSDGRVFDGLTDAINDLRSNGYPKASSGTLCMALKGVRGKAYGYGWEYA